MTDSVEQTTKVSDPGSPDYDPHSPFYDVTADSSSDYYVGPLADKAASGDEIRAGAGATTDLLYNLFGWPKDALPEFKDGLTQSLYERQLEESRKGLEKDLDLRSPGNPPSTVWGNATHEQMEAAITQDADSAVVAESSEEWVRIGNDLATHQHNLAKAINASTANWQGEGGDSAREHLAGVGKWLGSTANGATLTGRQQQIHSQTLNETQKQMAANPPVPFNVQEANANLQTITNPYVYMSQLGKDLETFRKQQDARERAAQVMTQFDTTVGSATATPAFPAPPKLASAQTAQKMASPAGGGAGSPDMQALRTPNAPEGANAPGGTDAFQRSGVLRTPEGDVAAPSLGPAGLPQISDTTHTSGYTPPSNTPPVNMPNIPNMPNLPDGGGPRTGSTFAPPNIHPIPTGPTGLGPGPVMPGSGKMPTIGRGGGINGDSISSRLGGLNPLPDGSSFKGNPLGGGGTGGSSGIGGGGAGAGGRIAGAGPLGGGGAVGAGAMDSEAAAARSATAGKGGTPGAMGPMGGGMAPGGAKGQGDDDKEHKLADYLELDDPSFFAPDDVVAPPVIGDWKNKDWK